MRQRSQVQDREARTSQEQRAERRRGYGWVTLDVWLTTRASRSSRKSLTTSGEASGGSAAMRGRQETRRGVGATGYRAAEAVVERLTVRAWSMNGPAVPMQTSQATFCARSGVSKPAGDGRDAPSPHGRAHIEGRGFATRRTVDRRVVSAGRKEARSKHHHRSRAAAAQMGRGTGATAREPWPEMGG
jgi:hypothetical protein